MYTAISRGLLFSVLAITLSAQAQQVQIPDLTGAFIKQTYPFLNPASTSEISHKGNLFFGHKQSLRTFSVFRQNYFNANFTLGTDSTTRHGLGLRIVNDRAGKYIAANRISFLYNYSLRLENNLRLSLGVAPTLLNYRKEAQSFGGTDNTGNLDLGLWLKSTSLNMGISVNQLIPSTLQVIDEIDTIRTYYAINGSYKYFLNPDINLRLQLLYLINSTLPNLPTIGLSFQYRSMLEATINYELNRNLVLVLGVRELDIWNEIGKIDLHVAFATPLAVRAFRRRNTIEWLINYNF